MIYNFKSSFKNVNADGQGTACLDFHMEVIDPEFRDQIMQDIMKLLTKEPEVEKEEKASALGFHQEGDEDE
jgi:hypothetical protein